MNDGCIIVALDVSSHFDAALGKLKAADTEVLMQLLEVTGRNLLKRQCLGTFGLGRTCRHQRRTEKGLVCALLDVPLTESDANELCFEHDPSPESRASMA